MRQMMRRSGISVLIVTLAVTTLAVAGCKKKPPVAFPPATGGPATPAGGGNPPPPAPVPPQPPTITDNPPVTSTAGKDLNAMAIDDINKPENSPLKPIYFLYDSDEIDDASKKILEANASVLKQYSTWVITVEGHCDERGTAEYNLALGDRRALSAKNYLMSLGIAADRLRTVSYGKEFPFDPGHDEGAWTKNRRAHFMLVSK
jgi:peptidoglycan-associated lipoprotein